MKKTDLFSDFPPISAQEWKEKITTDLKGKDFENTLVWKDENEIKHQPYYTKESNLSNELLDTIQKAQPKDQKWRYISPIEKSNMIDPIGQCISSKGSYEETTSSLENILKENVEKATDAPFLLVDGGIYKNAGATIIQELAYTLHHLSVYLDHFSAQAYNSNVIEKILIIKLDQSTSYFPEIAKGRAFRFLLKQLTDSYQLNIQPRLWGEASLYFQAHEDAHTNLLRLSSQCMSAILGNFDLIGLPSFDELGKPSTFGQRMSANITRILEEESFFNEVSDISGGSYYIETLTSEVAQKAWELFLQIESEGGLKGHFTSGKLEEQLSYSHKERVRFYKEGEKVMIGVNKFPNNEGKKLNLIEHKDIMNNAPLSTKIN